VPQSNCKKWIKMGLIFKPGYADWMHTHAQNPLPELIADDICRVHFASRDKNNQARGGYFDFSFNNPQKILNISSKPSLDFGCLGAFDDSGVMPSVIVDHNHARYMYYTGWSKAVTVPFSFHIGLAISKDGGRYYERVSSAPVLGRNHHDPYITASPYVLVENNIFRMWYTSGTEWISKESGSKPKHYYTIKYAESNDGLNWKTNSRLCIHYERGEYAIARPVIFKEEGKYRMWFSFRGGDDTYRIGTASSQDGNEWERDLECLAIDVSESGWDSEMICYAHPIYYKNRMYALYNGNRFGATGIGLAVLEE
jgi:hypothetical protein